MGFTALPIKLFISVSKSGSHVWEMEKSTDSQETFSYVVITWRRQQSAEAASERYLPTAIIPL